MLTARQRLALQEQLSGHATADTAELFGVSPSAIRNRRRRALASLGDEQRAGYLRALNRGRKHRIVPMQLSMAENV